MVGDAPPHDAVPQAGSAPSDRLTCIDLFCGCGGFSLGLIRAGIEVLAAIDFNSEAVDTASINLGVSDKRGICPYVDRIIPHILHKDLTTFRPRQLAKLLGRDHVDIIVGGPPCQGFSSARQRDGANHGTRRLVHDTRRHLYKEFLKFVEHFRPRLFVMENVLGIKSAAGGEYYTRVLHEARKLGYRVQSQIEEAQKFGVPQKRRRQLFIGVDASLSGFFPTKLGPARPDTPEAITLEAALADLPALEAGEGEYERTYDKSLRSKAVARVKEANWYLREILEVERTPLLTSHVARPHNEVDLNCFASLKQGESSATAVRRDPSLWFPYNRNTFKDRYTRQSMKSACSTIVAHLSKDGLMFIHPTQNRSLTPREAARIQSFPDWFLFPKARTHAFRLIGNAVPPLVAEAVGREALRFLAGVQAPRKDTALLIGSRYPDSKSSAARRIESILEYNRAELAQLSDSRLVSVFEAIFFLYPGLHPDEQDHGTELDDSLSNSPLRGQIDERLLGPCYARSGWPVALVPILEEATKRYRTGRLTEAEYYPHEAQAAGILCRAN